MPLSPSAWQSDLAHLAKELPERHADLFFSLSERAWAEAVARLHDAIPKLSDDRVIVELMRLVARIGDAHTRVDWARREEFTRLPLALHWFSDGCFVVEAATEYRETLGARVIRIGVTPVDDALSAVLPLISTDNDVQPLYLSPALLTTPEILTAVGIDDPCTITVERPSGESLAVHVEPVGRTEETPLEAVECEAVPLYRKDPDIYWFEHIPQRGLLYVQYNSCGNRDDYPFSAFADRVLAVLDDTPVDKLVFDVRNNGGGNSAIADPFIEAIASRDDVNRRGKLFVITGHKTFSSAVLNSLSFREKTEALLVGQPTGGRPNCYGEVRGFSLPDSGLDIDYSTKYFSPAEEDTPSVRPDILVDVSAADYLAGRDPMLEAVLRYGL